MVAKRSKCSVCEYYNPEEDRCEDNFIWVHCNNGRECCRYASDAIVVKIRKRKGHMDDE